MDRRIRSFMHDAPRGREYRVDVKFECVKCGKPYQDMEGALLCLERHVGTPTHSEEVVSRFQQGNLKDFLCVMVVETPSGNHLYVHDSETLLSVLEDNVGWMMPRDYAKVMWDTFQYTVIAILVALSAAVGYAAYLGNIKPALVMVVFWSVYLWHYHKLRESGWLGNPMPVIPWRLALALQVVTWVSSVLGWWWGSRV